MVGDSNGHTEASPSQGIDGKGSRRRNENDGKTVARAAAGTGDPRVTVRRATELGRLDGKQAKALSDLLSRTALLGFESRRIIGVMVTNIALEDSRDMRTELALQLKEYLEGDGLAKDLVPALSSAFTIE